MFSVSLVYLTAEVSKPFTAVCGNGVWGEWAVGKAKLADA